VGVCLVEIAEEDQKFLQNAASPRRAQAREQREVPRLAHWPLSLLHNPPHSTPFVSLRPDGVFQISGPAQRTVNVISLASLAYCDSTMALTRYIPFSALMFLHNIRAS
jgi:hypothetical protein